MQEENSLKKAVQLMGGVSAAAEKLRLKNYQVVQQWMRKRVPAERCPDIERSTGGLVTCEELRPDLAEQWAYLRGTKKEAA